MLIQHHNLELIELKHLNMFIYLFNIYLREF